MPQAQRELFQVMYHGLDHPSPDDATFGVPSLDHWGHGDSTSQAPLGAFSAGSHTFSNTPGTGGKTGISGVHCSFGTGGRLGIGGQSTPRKNRTLSKSAPVTPTPVRVGKPLDESWAKAYFGARASHEAIQRNKEELTAAETDFARLFDIVILHPVHSIFGNGGVTEASE
jgi:hypothetical protein